MTSAARAPTGSVASRLTRDEPVLAGRLRPARPPLGDRPADPAASAFLVTAFAGGGGVIAYAVLAVVFGARDDGGISLVWRRDRRSWRVAAGVGLLALSFLLTLRALGIWFSDAAVWPVVLTCSGLALLWRQSGLPRRATGPRTLLGVGLIVGGGIAFLSATDALGGLGHLGLAAAWCSSAPCWCSGRGGCASARR